MPACLIFGELFGKCQLVLKARHCCGDIGLSRHMAIIRNGGLMSVNGRKVKIYRYLSIALKHSWNNMHSNTKPQTETMLTTHQWGLVAFTWGECRRKCSIHLSSMRVITNQILQPHIPWVYESNKENNTCTHNVVCVLCILGVANLFDHLQNALFMWPCHVLCVLLTFQLHYIISALDTVQIILHLSQISYDLSSCWGTYATPSNLSLSG